jgi:hypothetical protein
MKSEATTDARYLASLPPDRKKGSRKAKKRAAK